jgi:2-phospho-L-lactate/phosphoenolpyruvate guanylyltransferase
MGRTVAVIPVRGSSSAKTRLAPLFTEDERLALVWAMLRRLVDAIRESGAVDQTLIVTRDAKAVASNIHLSEDISVLRQPADFDGLNGALDFSRDWAHQKGYDTMMVLPGDLPMIGEDDIRALREANGSLVVASDRDEEGTNALRIDLHCWETSPFRFHMGPGSFAHHFAEAAGIGHRATPLFRVGIAHDLDSPRDWADLSSSRQRALLQEIHDSLNAAGYLV